MAERWRVGPVGTTLYRDGELVGGVETPEVAAEIVETMNRVARLLAEVRATHPVQCDATTTGLLAALVEPGHVHRCVHPARRPSTPGRYDHRCECGSEWTEVQQPGDAERRSEATPQNDLLGASRVDPYDHSKGFTPKNGEHPE